jgi:Protein of unknown function (DUF3102)
LRDASDHIEREHEMLDLITVNDALSDSISNDSEVADLATRIEAEHIAVGQALQSALTHAIACGKLLIEAKLQFGEYGEWSPWLMDNCSVSARTARVYMALARRLEQLTDENGNVLPISVRQAVDLINTQRRSDSEPHTPPQAAVWKHNHETFVTWAVKWGKFTPTLIDITRITDKANGAPPKPSTVAKAARQGRTPGLTAENLRKAITLLTSYAEALERS